MIGISITSAPQILLNLMNEEVYIPDCVKGAVTAADQAEQLLAVEVAVILHLGPIVTEAHNGSNRE